MQFNEKLKELRLKKGISQTELAEKIFVSRSAVAKWENGLGLPSDDSLNQLAEFFEVEREELYSDKATEAVIVEKNKTISKSRKLLIIISAVCLAIVIAFIVTVSIISNLNNARPNDFDNEQPIGASDATMYGVSGTISDESNPDDRLLNEQSEYKNAYILVVGKTYTLEVSPRFSGGSRPIGITAAGVALLYDNDVFDIELINEANEPITDIPPKYRLTVKKQCQFGLIAVSSNNFYECLIISTTEV